MKEQNLKHISWKMAMTGGLLLGAALVAFMFLGYFMRDAASYSWIVSMLEFAVLAGTIYWYAHKMAVIHGAAGFSFGQSMGFIIKMMLFAGVISGIGTYLLYHVVAPEYYTNLMEANLLKQGLSESYVETTMKMMAAMTNPIVMIISGILGMIVYGGVVGLVVSALVKRPADPFHGDTPATGKNNTENHNAPGNDPH